jgi:hypothetical protein
MSTLKTNATDVKEHLDEHNTFNNLLEELKRDKAWQGECNIRHDGIDKRMKTIEDRIGVLEHVRRGTR